MERRHERLIYPPGLGGGKVGVESTVWKGEIIDCSGVFELERILF